MAQGQFMSTMGGWRQSKGRIFAGVVAIPEVTSDVRFVKEGEFTDS